MLAAVPQAIPLLLLLTTPPRVQAISLAGSGPSLRPCRASRALTARTVAPGPTRTRIPSSSTSMLRKCLRVSTRMPSVPACPDRLVPPERNVMGMPWVAAAPSSRPTSVASTGSATACGTRA